MNELFPTYLTNQSPFLFLLHFIFVLLVFLGQYFLCLFIQERKKIFVHVALESFLFVPFFLSPFILLFSWLQLGNVFYGVMQFLFVAFSLAGLWKYKNTLNRKLFQNIGSLEWLCYGVVFILGYFGWLVPIPDNYNGHGHVLWNVLTRMLETGSYTLLDRSSLSSDDIIQLFFPPHLVFLLRFYCMEAPLFFYRSAFLVPILVGFLLIQIVKDICKTFGFPKNAGLLGFMVVIGTFFNSTILFDIQYDVFSLLMLLYFISLLAKLLLKREKVFGNIFVLIFFAYLIRTQIFIIFFFALTLMLFVGFKRMKGLWGMKPTFVLLGLLPLLIWLGVSWVKYDHPMWPQSRGVVERVFQVLNPHHRKQKTINIAELPLVTREEHHVAKAEAKSYGARVQYFLDLFHRYFPNNDWFLLSLFFLRVGPLSLMLTFIFFILMTLKKLEFTGKEFLLIEGLLLFGWFAEYLLFYIGHNKFPQYLSAVMLLPAGLVLHAVGKKIKLLPITIVIILFLNFNILLFGHHNVDFHFFPSQILLGQKTFIEKLAYKSNKSVFEVQKESEELYQAYNSGKRILHIEVEPGGLLPSLMGREFFGDAFYCSMVNYQMQDVLTAKNKEFFAKSLEQRNIGFIFFPQRSHGALEEHPLFLTMKELEKRAQYHLLVPVEAVIENMQYPL